MATIDGVIDDALNLSTELLGEARDMVNDAQRIAQGRSFVNVRDLSWESSADPVSEFLTASLPADFADTFTLPVVEGLDDPLVFQDNYIPNVPDIPGAPDVLDTSRLFNIDRPNWDISDFTEDAPNVNTDVSLPADPIVNLPDDPSGAGSVIDVPEIEAPTFDDTMESHDIAEVDVTGVIASEFDGKRVELAEAADSYADAWLTKYCPDYHAGLATLEDRIHTAMQGGSAMDEAWEQAIYDRAQVRVNDQSHIAQEAVTEDYARRGFPLPPGAVMSALSRIRHEGARNLADTAGNIANERARVELQHLQFGMQISATLRQHFSSAMQNYMQLVFTANGIALQYASEIGRWAAELFNQRVELYRLEIQRYQAEAGVYVVRLESAFAIIRQFEVQIEAERLKIDLDQNEIQLFEAKIRGELSKVEVYNSQLQGVRTLLEAEAQKISVYEAQVRAYAARVGGKSSEYDAYRAAIQGDAAKVDAHQAEVQAYGQRVNAAATVVNAERTISQSISDFNQQLIDQRDSTIRKYIADITAEGKRFDGSVDIQKLALAQYTTEVEGRLRLVVAQFDKDRLELRADIARVETNLAAQTTNVNGYIRTIASQAGITTAGGNIIGDMASSALTTNNTILTQEDG